MAEQVEHFEEQECPNCGTIWLKNYQYGPEMISLKFLYNEDRSKIVGCHNCWGRSQIQGDKNAV